MANPSRQDFLLATTVLGGQQPVNLDFYKIPFQASVLVDLVSGSVNYAIEFTTDDLATNTLDLLRWNTVPNLPAGQTTTQQYTVNFPVTAVRLNIQSLTGEVRMSVIQGIGTD